MTPYGVDEAVLNGPCIDVWAPDVADEVEAWWAARRRWREGVDAAADAAGVEPWQVSNLCARRRPYRASPQ